MAMIAETVFSEESAGSADAGGSRPVDLVHLARYTMGNRALEREVLEMFLAQSELYLTRLSQADNIKTWRDAAHTIKGSARGIGAWRVASCAEEAELLNGSGLDTRRQGAIDELSVTIGEVNGYIRFLLSDA